MPPSDAGQATQPILDETGQPIGVAAEAPPLVDETGRAMARHDRAPDLLAQVEQTLRGLSWGALLVGVMIGYALGQVRR